MASWSSLDCKILWFEAEGVILVRGLTQRYKNISPLDKTITQCCWSLLAREVLEAVAGVDDVDVGRRIDDVWVIFIVTVAFVVAFIVAVELYCCVEDEEGS